MDTASTKVLKFAKIIWIKEEIKKRHQISLHIKVLHVEKTDNLHPVDFDNFNDEVKEYVQKKF